MAIVDTEKTSQFWRNFVMAATIAVPGLGALFLLIYATVFTYIQASRTDDRSQVFKILKIWLTFAAVHFVVLGLFLLITNKTPDGNYSPAPLFYTFVVQFVIAQIALFNITRNMIAPEKWR